MNQLEEPHPRVCYLIQEPSLRTSSSKIQAFPVLGDVCSGPVERIIPLIEPEVRNSTRSAQFRLKVLHINDFHGQISRLTPHGYQPIFSRLVWQVRYLRRQYRDDANTDVLFLSAGDDTAGSIFDDLEAQPKHEHHIYYLYSAAGLDACALGNHDLDISMPVLARAIRTNARFPFLSANLKNVPDLHGLFYPAVLFLIKGVRVGVIGLTTQAQIKELDGEKPHLKDPAQVINNLLPAFKPFCDVVMILSHLGYKLDSDSARVIDGGDVELAQRLPYAGVHLIIGGHTHHALNENGLSTQNIVNGIPIVQAGSLGRFLGETTITINGNATVTDARLLTVNDFPVDETFEQRTVQPILDQLRPYLNRSIGSITKHPDLGEEAVRNDFTSGESALANFITDSIVGQCRAKNYPVSLAMIDSSVVQNGLPSHTELTFNDLLRVMPYADTIRLVYMSGRQLYDLLNDNALRIDRPDEPHTERGFLHFSQALSYRIVLGKKRSDAYADHVMVNEKPLEMQLDQQFLIAYPCFLRELASPWERLAGHHSGLLLFNHHSWQHTETGLFLRQELITHIHQAGGITQQAGAKRDGRLQIIAEAPVLMEALR